MPLPQVGRDEIPTATHAIKRKTGGKRVNFPFLHSPNGSSGAGYRIASDNVTDIM